MQVFDVQFDYYGKSLAMACSDGSVRIIDIQTNQTLSSFKNMSSANYSLSWANQKFGQVLAIGTSDGNVSIWKQVKEWQKIINYSNSTSSINTLAWISNDLILAAGCGDGLLIIYQKLTDNWNPPVIENAHISSITCLQWQPGSSKLVTTSADGSIKIWNYSESKLTLVKELENLSTLVLSLAVNENFIVCGTNNSVKIWLNFNLVQTIQTAYPVEKLTFSLFGSQLATNQEIFELSTDGLYK